MMEPQKPCFNKCSLIPELLQLNKIHTQLFHPRSQHLHKRGQHIPSIERSRHRQVCVFKIRKVGDGGGGLRRIWRFEVGWHGIGQLSRGAYVQDCVSKRKKQTSAPDAYQPVTQKIAHCPQCLTRWQTRVEYLPLTLLSNSSCFPYKWAY